MTVGSISPQYPDAIVKLVLMYDGRPLKKTKTTPKANDSNPVFNETFVFDVPPYQLDKVYFHLAVIGIEKVGVLCQHSDDQYIRTSGGGGGGGGGLILYCIA